MGNREDLLAGARRCLEERGWGRTTVRDIAAASGGISHAAIGYHFGSRERLLMEAFFQSMEEWEREVAGAMGAADPAAPSERRLEAMWERIIESIHRRRPLWVANLEALVEAQRSPELRRQLAEGQAAVRHSFAAMVLGVDEELVSEQDARRVGAVHLALLGGVVAMCLTDPDHSPSGSDIVLGLRAMGGLATPGA
ncbi:MAG TPA: TetR/AcrR family transcriptional regulator [Candidatus Dormibacteraeota bacterium]|nr:TetR/AcrR family transcriptional regulator [Candidatus Dormibacteraeota bacterium]